MAVEAEREERVVAHAASGDESPFVAVSSDAGVAVPAAADGMADGRRDEVPGLGFVVVGSAALGVKRLD
jgi:hypothetical protein